MSLTSNEFWAVAHGLVFGSIFLLAFPGGIAGLLSLRKKLLTESGLYVRMRVMHYGIWTMAVISWITVITGTFLVYPNYRADTPGSPKNILLSNPHKAAWHNFAMEWKEHIAWFAPILATVVAYIVTYYAQDLAEKEELRRSTLILLILSFFCASIAGLAGAFISKAAPVL